MKREFFRLYTSPYRMFGLNSSAIALPALRHESLPGKTPREIINDKISEPKSVINIFPRYFYAAHTILFQLMSPFRGGVAKRRGRNAPFASNGSKYPNYILFVITNRAIQCGVAILAPSSVILQGFVP